MKTILLAVAILIAMATTATARCSCQCVNNDKQWVCTNSWDVPTGWCGGPCY